MIILMTIVKFIILMLAIFFSIKSIALIAVNINPVKRSNYTGLERTIMFLSTSIAWTWYIIFFIQ